MTNRLQLCLLVCAGSVLPSLVLAQPVADVTAPDYAQGYERLKVPRFDAEPSVATPPPDRTTPPLYRFRGDPPASAGLSADGGADSGLKFRPLTPTERERMGPTTRWRPTDDERQPSVHKRPERATLFEQLTPAGAPLPDPWAGERD